MRISGRFSPAAAAILVLVFGAPAARTAPPPRFELTVDSIMRGPKLVGYPQTGLRWSGDSSRLYFEWRRPADDEAATWVVGREGGEPRKLTDEERSSAPTKMNRRVQSKVSQRLPILPRSERLVRRHVDRVGNESH